jgi:hypothetical protein
MHSNLIAAAAKLSDSDLLHHVAALAGGERYATVDLIAHLAEIDRRKLYRGLGYGSLFSYCTDALRLSEHAAFNRIEAARASCTSLHPTAAGAEVRTGRGAFRPSGLVMFDTARRPPSTPATLPAD